MGAIRDFYERLMALIARSFRWLVNPDGTVNGHFPNGDKDPSPGTVSWSSIAALADAISNRTTGSAFTHDLRQYLEGTAAANPAVTFVVETVSGDNAATEGWAISTDDLTHPGNNEGLGSLRIGATLSGNTVYTAAIPWNWQAAVVTDTTAPTVPLKLTGTPANNSILWEWDQATDPHDGSLNGSGVKEYDLEINGAVTVVSAAAPGLTTAYTLYTIGSPNPAPSVIQSGADWELTSEGMFNLSGGADRGMLLGRSISGDFTISCYVPSSSGSSSGPRAGIQIREDVTAVGSKFLTAQLRYLAAETRLNVRYRSTAGATVATALDLTGITAAYIRVSRAGDVFTVEYSTDQKNYTLAATVNLTLATTVTAGWDVTSQVTDASTTVTLQQCAISSAARASYTQNTVTANRTARIRARDLATPANVSAYGPVTDTVSPIVTGAPLVKWHPGHGVFLTATPASAASKVYDDAWIAELQSMTNVKHVLMQFYWGAIETAQGVYNPALIDNFIATCDQYGKKALIRVVDRVFTAGTISQQISVGRLPNYINTILSGGGSGYFDSTTQNLIGSKLFEPLVMDRIIALHSYLANRYDTDSRVEGVFTDESSLPASGISGFSDQAYLAQWKRFVSALAQSWAHTNVFLLMNNAFGSISLRVEAMDHAVANRMLLSGPDIYSDSSFTQFQRVYIGTDGGHDYNGEIATGFEVEGPNLGGNHTPSGIDPATIMDVVYAKAYTNLHSSYIIWLRKTFNFDPDTNDIQWDNASYPKIKTWLSQSGALIPVVTSPPSNYSGNVDTG